MKGIQSSGGHTETLIKLSAFLEPCNLLPAKHLELDWLEASALGC